MTGTGTVIPWATARAAAILAGASLVGLACAGGGVPANAAPDATPDTVRGVVAVVGADPLTRVMIEADGRRLTVAGPAEDGLRRVHGLEVRVDGRIEGSTLTAARFRVRALGELPAADGTLEVDGDTAVLVTPDGDRLSFGSAPPALRARAGARVWIAGHEGDAPQAWGVITDEAL